MPIMLYPNPCCSKFLINFLNIIISYILPIIPLQPLHALLPCHAASHLCQQPVCVSFHVCLRVCLYTAHTHTHTHTHSSAHIFWGFVQCLLFKNGILVYAPLCISLLFFFNFLIFINLFIYFWLCWVFVAASGLSLAGFHCGKRGYSLLRCVVFSLRWLLLLRSTGSRHVGSVAVARGLQSTGSVVVAHELSCSAACGIFRDQGLNPCPLHWQADS